MAQSLDAQRVVVGLGVLLLGEVQPVTANDQYDFGDVLHVIRVQFQKAMLVGMLDSALGPSIYQHGLLGSKHLLSRPFFLWQWNGCTSPPLETVKSIA